VRKKIHKILGALESTSEIMAATRLKTCPTQTNRNFKENKLISSCFHRQRAFSLISLNPMLIDE
jgi:hypothetical protein